MWSMNPAFYNAQAFASPVGPVMPRQRSQMNKYPKRKTSYVEAEEKPRRTRSRITGSSSDEAVVGGSTPVASSKSNSEQASRTSSIETTPSSRSRKSFGSIRSIGSSIKRTFSRMHNSLIVEPRERRAAEREREADESDGDDPDWHWRNTNQRMHEVYYTFL